MAGPTFGGKSLADWRQRIIQGPFLTTNAAAVSHSKITGEPDAAKPPLFDQIAQEVTEAANVRTTADLLPGGAGPAILSTDGKQALSHADLKAFCCEQDLAKFGAQLPHVKDETE